MAAILNFLVANSFLFKKARPWLVSACERFLVKHSVICCTNGRVFPTNSVLLVSVQRGAHSGAGAGAEGAADLFTPHTGTQQAAGGQQQPVSRLPGPEEQTESDTESEPALQLRPSMFLPLILLRCNVLGPNLHHPGAVSSAAHQQFVGEPVQSESDPEVKRLTSQLDLKELIILRSAKELQI